ncbi:unnamed protein product [Closterium sp. Naga37s-1]|nr:unnamed protein product [Closterium sp. Naga37s-1]
MASAAFPALSSTVAPAPSTLWSANLTVSFPPPWHRRVLSASPISGRFPPPVPSQTRRLLLAEGSAHLLFCLPPFPCFLHSSPLILPNSPLPPIPGAVSDERAVAEHSAGAGRQPRARDACRARDPQPGYIVQAFVTALMLSTLQGLPPHQLSAYDDLSATLSFRRPSSAPADPSILEVPLVRGSPFLTFIFPPGGPPATPMLTTIHAITGVEGSSDSSKYRVALNNGQTWLVYLSALLTLRQDGSMLAADVPFTGTMRVALLPGSSTQDEEALLDAHLPTVPLVLE